MGFLNFNKAEKAPPQENKAKKILNRAVLGLLLATAPMEALPITSIEHAKMVKEMNEASDTDKLIEMLKELKEDETTHGIDMKNRLSFKIKEVVGNDVEKAKQVIYQLVDQEKILSEGSGLINLLRMVAESEKN